MLWAFVALLAFQSFPSLPIGPDLQKAMSGAQMNSSETAANEEILRRTPDDKNAHLKLLGRYYSNVESSKGRDYKQQWANEVFWLIDHDPRSPAFEFGFAPMADIRTGKAAAADDNLAGQAKLHWEKALSAAPDDPEVLKHAAMQYEAIGSAFSLPLLQKIAALQPSCASCKESVASAEAFVILDLGSSDERGTMVCLHSEPIQATQMKDQLRNETDPKILITAGLTLKGYSGLHQTQCKGSQAGMIALGTELIDKAVTLDPSLRERYKLTGTGR